MKTFFLGILILILFAPMFVVAWAPGQPILPTCPETGCGFTEFFAMLGNIYSFIVLELATPLAVIAIIVGAIFMMASAGNPNLFGTGKKILYSAIIGLVLVYASKLIIDTILKAIGYQGQI